MHDPDGMPNGKQLSIEVEQDGEALVIRPLGELDVLTTQTLDAELREAINGDAPGVILDLGGLTFVDSSGLRLLVFATAHSRHNGDRLRMLHGSPGVEREIKLGGLDRSLPFFH
jgi:anti-anti-sigma factor